MGNGSSNIYPVHVLGRSYQDTDQEELLKHTESFFRFTYRRDIPAFCSSSLTSDAGWGCMLRAAQMVMGNTLLRHYLGPDWRIPPDVQASRVRRSRQQTLAENAVYCELVRWFSDHPGAPHLYSLHHLVHLGLARYDKPAGQWVGPSTAAYMLRDLAKLHCALYGGSMEVLVTQGDTIYAAEATAVCTRTAESRADFVRCLRQAWEDPAPATDPAAAEADGDKLEGVADEDVAALEDGDDPEVPIHPLLLPRSASEGQLQEAEDAVMVRSCLSVLSDGSYIECSTNADAPAETDGEPVDALPKKTSRHESQRRADSSGSASAPTHKKDEFFDPLLRPPPKQRPVWSAALMVLVPLRLGIHSLNPEYYEEVKEVLRHRHCMGILGGRPNHAIYFVGHRGDFLLGLDPHTVFPNAPAASAEQHTTTEGTAGPRPPPHVPFNGAAAGGGDKGRRKSGADASIKSSDKHTAESCRSQSADSGSSSGMTGVGASAGKHGHKRQLGLSSPYNLPATAPSPDCAPAESMFSGGLGSFGAAFTGSGAPSAAPPSVFPSAEYLAQVHVSEFVTLEISRLDPSLTLAFYFPTQAEFDAFFEETVISTAAKLRAGRTPLYTVQQTVPAFMYAPVDDEEDAAAWNRRSSGRRKAAAEESARRRGSSCSSAGDSKEMRTSSFDPSDVDEAVSSGAATGADGTRRSRGRSARGVGAIPGLQQQSADSGDEDWLLI